MSVKCTPPHTPLLYSITGVYRGIHFFLIFALKHRLWVLIRTASMRRFLCVPTINVLEQKKKNIIIFHLKINIFTAVKYCCILYGCVCVMTCLCNLDFYIINLCFTGVYIVLLICVLKIDCGYML